MGKTSESITALNALLETSPTDAEAWAELADMYLSQGLYSQAVFALEETLVLAPNAWNVCVIPFLLHLLKVANVTNTVRIRFTREWERYL
jgi:tetratricopeptide (TPR) repeat protein